tara:strand:+ start:651 stop:1478 length:828 start_codon:yes stop_codon:yes gene_type:complete
VNPAEIVQFIGIPVAVATAILMLSWWALPAKHLQSLGAIIAVGVATLVAFALQEGLPSLPPTQQWHWLVLTVLAVFLFTCLYPFFQSLDNLVVLQALIAGIIASVFMQFPGQDSFLYRICILFLVLFVSIGLRQLKLPSWHLYIASWSVLACLSILALQASFAKLAFFAGSMSAVAGAMFVLQIVKPKETRSVQMLFGVLIVGCGMCGAAYDPSRAVPLFAWFLPMAGITLAAVVYFLCKTKYKAAFSIAALELCVLFSVIWTFLQMTPNEEMWP